MNISKIKEVDAPAFSKLAKRIILESPDYSDTTKKECIHCFSIKKIKSDLKDKTILLIAAKNKGKPVGFSRGHFEDGIATGIFWLQWLGIDAAYRRSGIADEMLSSLTKKLKTKKYGTHKIVCVIRPENNASMSLFKKNKYRKLTTLKKHWYREDFTLWYKNL